MRVVLFVENSYRGGMDSFFINLINQWPYPDDELVLAYNYDHPGGDVIRNAVTRPCTFVPHHVPLHWRVVATYAAWLPHALRLAARYALRMALLPVQVHALRRLFEQIGGDRLLVVNGAYPGGESCRAAAMAWARLGRSPYVFNIRNFAIPPRRGTGVYENWCDAQVIAGARCFVGVSRACAESLRVRPAFTALSNIRHIYNGVSLAPATASAGVPDLRAMFGIGDGPICLMLATYEPRKGHAFLFEAFAIVKRSVPEAHLVVCGDGSGAERHAVESLRAASPVRDSIHLGGYIPNGPALIPQAAVLAVASQEWESFGWTVIEAMTRGVPVVTTNVRGLGEVVGDDGVAGFTVSPSDVDTFAARLALLLAQPVVRRRIGEAGRARVAQCFEVGRMVRQYAAVVR